MSLKKKANQKKQVSQLLKTIFPDKIIKLAAIQVFFSPVFLLCSFSITKKNYFIKLKKNSITMLS